MSDNLVSFTAVKARGWTPALVRDFLGEPDSLARNPYYRSGAPVKLYAQHRILAVETTDAFNAAKEAAGRRSKSAKAAADVRRQELIAEIRAMVVTVSHVPLETLMRKSLAHWKANARSGEWRDGSDADNATRGRWAVNYARHHRTHYDTALEAVAGRVGIGDAVDIIRAKVYRAIADAWPSLAAECTRQANDRGVGMG